MDSHTYGHSVHDKASKNTQRGGDSLFSRWRRESWAATRGRMKLDRCRPPGAKPNSCSGLKTRCQVLHLQCLGWLLGVSSYMRDKYPRMSLLREARKSRTPRNRVERQSAEAAGRGETPVTARGLAAVTGGIRRLYVIVPYGAPEKGSGWVRKVLTAGGKRNLWDLMAVFAEATGGGGEGIASPCDRPIEPCYAVNRMPQRGPCPPKRGWAYRLTLPFSSSGGNLPVIRK